jgi:hypothetical protein
VAPRRLVPAAKVAEWEQRLHDAAGRALDEMRVSVRQGLVHAGITPPSGLVAASKGQKAAIGAAAGLAIWQAAAWVRAVNVHVTPTADAIAKEATQTAMDAVPPEATWGMPSSAPAISGGLVAAAVASGAYLGSRLNTDVVGSTDPAAAVENVFSTADDIIGGQLGAAAEGASNQATGDVASYLASAMGDVYTDATKTWNAVGDDATRLDHMDADGQEVGLNGTFTVGGEDLLYPGDPAGSDEQTLNCRCWLTTDGIDPGIAVYGEDDTTDASTGLEDILNRAGTTSDLPTSPRSYPN